MIVIPSGTSYFLPEISMRHHLVAEHFRLIDYIGCLLVPYSSTVRGS